MNFKKVIAGVMAGAILVMGVGFAEAKSRVSSKPSSFSRPSYSAPKVTSRPSASSYSAPRVVTKQTPVYRSTPIYRSAPQRTTVIQKNYYGGNGGHSNYGGGYGGSMGGGGLGSSIVGGAVGAAGGMMLMDALTEDEGEKALKLQQEQQRIEAAKDQQERDDKQDQILENQQELKEEAVPEPSDSFFKVNPNLLPAQ